MSEIKNPLPECPSSPNCVRKAFVLESDSSQTFVAANKALEILGAETIDVNPEELKIDAVFRIPVFGYRDDVSIIIQPDKKASILYIRSASREGYWDIFVNSIRVRRIINKTKKQLSN
jgi:uncharacterized protein (DUF1499 family)